MQWVGKTVLITGASSGIGHEFAKQIHQRGARVVVVARRIDRLEELSAQLNHARPGSCVILCANLVRSSSEIGIEAVTEYIQRNRIDVLVNNAGFGLFGDFETLGLSPQLEMIALNVFATVQLAHAVTPQMKERRDGVIVSLSSVAGFQPLPYLATYSATKAFNLVHSLALRHELKEFGIRVVTICPGPTVSEFRVVSGMPGLQSAAQDGRTPVELVVSQSITAIEKNRPFIVPGLRARLLSLPSRILPIDWCTKMIGKKLRRIVPS